MRIQYMGLLGDEMLLYGCTLPEAKDICALEAMEELTWSDFGVEGSGSLMAKDSFGHKFYVIQYQAE